MKSPVGSTDYNYDDRNDGQHTTTKKEVIATPSIDATASLVLDIIINNNTTAATTTTNSGGIKNPDSDDVGGEEDTLLPKTTTTDLQDISTLFHAHHHATTASYYEADAVAAASLVKSLMDTLDVEMRKRNTLLQIIEYESTHLLPPLLSDPTRDIDILIAAAAHSNTNGFSQRMDASATMNASSSVTGGGIGLAKLATIPPPSSALVQEAGYFVPPDLITVIGTMQQLQRELQDKIRFGVPERWRVLAQAVEKMNKARLDLSTQMAERDAFLLASGLEKGTSSSTIPIANSGGVPHHSPTPTTTPSWPSIHKNKNVSSTSSADDQETQGNTDMLMALCAVLERGSSNKTAVNGDDQKRRSTSNLGRHQGTATSFLDDLSERYASNLSRTYFNDFCSRVLLDDGDNNTLLSPSSNCKPSAHNNTTNGKIHLKLPPRPNNVTNNVDHDDETLSSSIKKVVSNKSPNISNTKQQKGIESAVKLPPRTQLLGSTAFKVDTMNHPAQFAAHLRSDLQHNRSQINHSNRNISPSRTLQFESTISPQRKNNKDTSNNAATTTIVLPTNNTTPAIHDDYATFSEDLRTFLRKDFDLQETVKGLRSEADTKMLQEEVDEIVRKKLEVVLAPVNMARSASMARMASTRSFRTAIAATASFRYAGSQRNMRRQQQTRSFRNGHDTSTTTNPNNDDTTTGGMQRRGSVASSFGQNIDSEWGSSKFLRQREEEDDDAFGSSVGGGGNTEREFVGFGGSSSMHNLLTASRRRRESSIPMMNSSNGDASGSGDRFNHTTTINKNKDIMGSGDDYNDASSSKGGSPQSPVRAHEESAYDQSARKQSRRRLSISLATAPLLDNNTHQQNTHVSDVLRKSMSGSLGDLTSQKSERILPRQRKSTVTRISTANTSSNKASRPNGDDFNDVLQSEGDVGGTGPLLPSASLLSLSPTLSHFSPEIKNNTTTSSANEYLTPQATLLADTIKVGRERRGVLKQKRGETLRNLHVESPDSVKPTTAPQQQQQRRSMGAVQFVVDDVDASENLNTSPRGEFQASTTSFLSNDGSEDKRKRRPNGPKNYDSTDVGGGDDTALNGGGDDTALNGGGDSKSTPSSIALSAGRGGGGVDGSGIQFGEVDLGSDESGGDDEYTSTGKVRTDAAKWQRKVRRTLNVFKNVRARRDFNHTYQEVSGLLHDDQQSRNGRGAGGGGGDLTSVGSFSAIAMSASSTTTSRQGGRPSGPHNGVNDEYSDENNNHYNRDTDEIGSGETDLENTSEHYDVFMAKKRETERRRREMDLENMKKEIQTGGSAIATFEIDDLLDVQFEIERARDEAAQEEAVKLRKGALSTKVRSMLISREKEVHDSHTAGIRRGDQELQHIERRRKSVVQMPEVVHGGGSTSVGVGGGKRRLTSKSSTLQNNNKRSFTRGPASFRDVSLSRNRSLPKSRQQSEINGVMPSPKNKDDNCDNYNDPPPLRTIDADNDDNDGNSSTSAAPKEPVISRQELQVRQRIEATIRAKVIKEQQISIEKQDAEEKMEDVTMDDYLLLKRLVMLIATHNHQQAQEALAAVDAARLPPPPPLQIARKKLSYPTNTTTSSTHQNTDNPQHLAGMLAGSHSDNNISGARHQQHHLAAASSTSQPPPSHSSRPSLLPAIGGGSNSNRSRSVTKGGASISSIFGGGSGEVGGSGDVTRNVSINPTSIHDHPQQPPPSTLQPVVVPSVTTSPLPSVSKAKPTSSQPVEFSGVTSLSQISMRKLLDVLRNRVGISYAALHGALTAVPPPSKTTSSSSSSPAKTSSSSSPAVMKFDDSRLIFELTVAMERRRRKQAASMFLLSAPVGVKIFSEGFLKEGRRANRAVARRALGLSPSKTWDMMPDTDSDGSDDDDITAGITGTVTNSNTTTTTNNASSERTSKMKKVKSVDGPSEFYEKEQLRISKVSQVIDRFEKTIATQQRTLIKCIKQEGKDERRRMYEDQRRRRAEREVRRREAKRAAMLAKLRIVHQREKELKLQQQQEENARNHKHNRNPKMGGGRSGAARTKSHQLLSSPPRSFTPHQKGSSSQLHSPISASLVVGNTQQWVSTVPPISDNGDDTDVSGEDDEAPLIPVSSRAITPRTSSSLATTITRVTSRGDAATKLLGTISIEVGVQHLEDVVELSSSSCASPTLSTVSMDSFSSSTPPE